MSVFKDRKEKTISCIVFAVYMLLLVWLVLFKFATSLDRIPQMRGLNLIPFRYDTASPIQVREILYNFIVFIPAGFYFAALFSKKNILLGTIAVAVVSFVFETIQWIFSIGASDVTDLITNTLGGLCGMMLFLLMGKFVNMYRMALFNILGIITESIGIVLFLVLLISNS